MYLQHTMLQIRVNMKCLQNLNALQYKLLFCFYQRIMWLFDSFMVSQFQVILVYINIVATALARKVFQP